MKINLLCPDVSYVGQLKQAWETGRLREWEVESKSIMTTTTNQLVYTRLPVLNCRPDRLQLPNMQCRHCVHMSGSAEAQAGGGSVA